MAITVIISLQLFTRLLYYTPLAILASIILSALPGLIDLNEAYNIWKIDKFDFLTCIAAFFGVLFASVEIGLLVAVHFFTFVQLNMPVFNYSMKYIIKNEELKKKVIIVKLVVGKTLAHENSVLIFNYFPILYQTRLDCTPTKKKKKKKSTNI
jgi:hypothetical protein